MKRNWQDISGKWAKKNFLKLYVASCRYIASRFEKKGLTTSDEKNLASLKKRPFTAHINGH